MSRLSLRTLPFVFLALMLFGMVTALPGAAGYVECTPGSVTYTGSVAYQSGSLPPSSGDVYVTITTQAGYQPGASGSAFTGANGAWSITLKSECPVGATYQWAGGSGTQSGPLLLSVAKYISGSTETLNVWTTSVGYNVVYAYPDTSGSYPNEYATVASAISTSSQIKVSVDAQYSAGMDLNFLSVTADGNYGTNLAITAGYSFSQTTDQPYVVYYKTGTAVKVEDTTGHTAVYVENAAMNSFQTESTSEWTTIASGESQNGYYTEVGCTHACPSEETEAFTLTSSLAVSGGVGMDFGAFGNTYKLTMTVEGTSTNTFTSTVTLYNNTPNTQCFVIYYAGANKVGNALDPHVWYYGSGNCP